MALLLPASRGGSPLALPDGVDGIGVMIMTVGMVLSEPPAFQFFPAIEVDMMAASVTMPQGTPIEATDEAVAKLEAGAARGGGSGGPGP